MKLPQYRNREPLQYRPYKFVKTRSSDRDFRRVYFPPKKRRKLPGVLVGSAGVVLLLVSELIQGVLGNVLFIIAVLSIATGGQFEIINRVFSQFKYFIVPIIAVILILVYLLRPQFFQPLLPKQDTTQLSHFSSGFPFSSNELTLTFGGGEGVSFTLPKRELEQGKTSSTFRFGAQIPFNAYVDRGKLFIDINVFAGTDLPLIHIKRNFIQDLPYRWDGDYDDHALEIVNADTVPVFQLMYMSEDHIVIKGIFPVQGGLAIADESGLSYVPGTRVLFYGTRPIFKYPSWKYPNKRISVF